MINQPTILHPAAPDVSPAIDILSSTEVDVGVPNARRRYAARKSVPMAMIHPTVLHPSASDIQPNPDIVSSKEAVVGAPTSGRSIRRRVTAAKGKSSRMACNE